MRFLVLVVCLSLSCQASAWRLFQSDEEEVVLDPVIDAIGDIEEQCLRAGHTGSCEFYNCLNRRFPCTAAGYAIRIGLHFCNKIDQAYENFDNFGQTWLNRTSICLLSYLLPIYESESTTCGAIQDAGISGIKSCNARRIEDRGFCDFIRTNGREYKNLMGAYEMQLLKSLNDLDIWRSMVEQAFRCLPDMLSSAFRRLADSVRDWVRNVGQTLRGLLNRI